MRDELLAGALLKSSAAGASLLYKPTAPFETRPSRPPAPSRANAGQPFCRLRCAGVPSHELHFDRFTLRILSAGTASPVEPPVALPDRCWPRAPFHRRRRHHRDRRRLLGHPGRWRLARSASTSLRLASASAVIPALDAIARERLTVDDGPHAGQQDHHVARRHRRGFTLGEGCDCPALSLHSKRQLRLSSPENHSRIERVPVVASLRHHDIEPVFNETTSPKAARISWKPSHPAVGTRHRARSRPRQSPPPTRTSSISTSASTGPKPPLTALAASIVSPLPRFALDKLVAEFDDRRQQHLGQSSR